MTSTPVNVQGFVSNTMYGTNRMQGSESKGDFGKIFENQKNSVEDVNETNLPENDVQETDTKDEIESYDKTDETVNQVQEQKESASVQESSEAGENKSSTDKDMNESSLMEEELQKVSEVLQSAVVDVKNLLMQELQLTEGELNQLMQEMNLTDADLLQMGNVKDLMLQAMGAEDMTALLTNESLYAQMKSVEGQFTDIMESVQNALEMNPEDVNVAVEQLDDSLNVKSDELLNNITTRGTEDVQLLQTQKTGEQDATKGEQSLMQENEANPFVTQQQINGTENVQTSATQTASFTSTVDAQNIMNQIMDYMKIQMNPETTQLEMQLHPESLGTLQIRISAKEGIMTAQFTTASEAVKGVLESQMIQLQQQFDQQNIKVEAIEITVQTHAFESALEQGNERQMDEEDSKKNRTRRIDLSRLEETDEITAEDQLVAEMMAANGNSVDYLA